MSEEADQFRIRAKECRQRAELADFYMRAYLSSLADDLDAEAARMDVEEAEAALCRKAFRRQLRYQPLVLPDFA